MKLLKVLLTGLLAISLWGCSNQGKDGNNTSMSTTSTTTTGGGMTFNGTDDILGYLKTSGIMSNDVMEIGELDQGYLEGRAFTSDGNKYSLYRYDRNDTGMMDMITNAKTTNRIRMKVNGEYSDVMAYIYDDYVLVYPDDVDIAHIKGIFDNINK